MKGKVTFLSLSKLTTKNIFYQPLVPVASSCTLFLSCGYFILVIYNLFFCVGTMWMKYLFIMPRVLLVCYITDPFLALIWFCS